MTGTKLMKRTLASFLALVLVVSLMTAVGMAENGKDSAWDVDYSTQLTVDTPYEGQVEATDPFIYVSAADWSGNAKGFTVMLEAGELYQFTATIAPSSGYGDRAIALYDGEVTTGEQPLVCYNSGSLRRVDIVYEPTETKEYSLLTWGYSENDDHSLSVGTAVTVSASTIEMGRNVEVSTAEELLEALNHFYVNIILTDDIDLSGEEYLQFDTYHTVLDGAGHTISGLETPLFDEIFCSEVKNLTMEGDIAVEDGFAFEHVGLMAGYTENSTFTNCSVKGTIAIDMLYDLSFIGGFVGEAQAPCTFLSCDSDVDMDISSGRFYNIGGFVGGSNQSSDEQRIYENCHTTGTITIDGDDGYCIGGFVGDTEDYDVFNTCTANTNLTFGENVYYLSKVGGFTGYIDEANQFINCVANGALDFDQLEIEEMYGLSCIGGFLGESSGGGENLFFNCYTTCDVAGQYGVGGFTGCIYDKDMFINCYAAGNVNAQDDCGSFFGYKFSEAAIARQIMEGEGPVFINCYSNRTFEDDLRGTDISLVDFGDDAAMTAMTEELNRYLTEDSADLLADLDTFYDEYSDVFTFWPSDMEPLNWVPKNEKNGPVLAIVISEVVFQDEDDTVLGTTPLYFDQVADTANITIPELPEREGYSAAWSEDPAELTVADMQAGKTITVVYTLLDAGDEDDSSDEPDDEPETGDTLPVVGVISIALAMFAVVVMARKRKNV